MNSYTLLKLGPRQGRGGCVELIDYMRVMSSLPLSTGGARQRM